MKKNWWMGCVLASSLVPAAALAGDKFDTMRERWAVKLVGSATQDRSAPEVVQQLRAASDAAQRSLASMARDPDAKALWSDIAGFDDPYLIRASSTIDKTAGRLEQMARAYAAPGGPSYHDARLGEGIAAGLDWLVRHYYTAGRREFGNWWTWQIGTPLELLNVLTLADDAVPAELRKRTLDAVNWHVPDGRYKTRPDGTVDKKWLETGANLLDKSLVMVLSGMLGKDGARIAAGRDGLAMTLDYATTGDGFYRDGSYIQHGHIAYNGGYGAVSLSDYARFLYILGGSEWTLQDPRAPRVFQWAIDGFATPMIDGAIPDALRGRGVSRQGQTGHTVGHGMAASLAVIAEQAPPAERAFLRSTIKGWMQRDRSFGGGNLEGSLAKEGGPYERQLLQRIAADPATPAAPQPEGARIYASMDRAILRGRGFAAVLSMSSPRISSFETGNSENLSAWWQGMGVLQLYDADQTQFDGDYWATIDPHRLPGTTTDHSGTGRAAEWKKYPNAETWVGGAALGKYAALGMAFSLREVTGSNLHGRKAWFQLGDRVLALGSGIEGGEGAVETIVDNRHLSDGAGARLLVDGQPLANGSKAGARWAHLQDDKSGSRIGYVFPQGASLRTDRLERSGSWRDINGLSGPAGVVHGNYQVLSIPQASSEYAYLVLPNASAEATRAAAGDPGMRIEANDEHAAAVSLPKEGVYAADLWQAGSAPRDGREYVWASAPAAVVASVADGRLQLAISEPTQLASTLEVRIAQPVAQAGKLGPGVTVLETSPQLRLRIDTAGAAGVSFKAEFTLPQQTQDVAKAQHGAIGIVEDGGLAPHTNHPDAQWFPQAGFGMFFHWGLSSVFDTRYQRVGDLSWAMIVGAWKNKTFTDPKEQARIIREADWNFDGKPPSITPNKYWEAAREFDPRNYDPDKWMAAAKAAGVTYVVLTTRHHEGFALWPSAYGGFDTKNYMGGRDLVRPFVDAARKYGLKVGLYYSPPNWYFDREYMNFMYYGTARMNPWLPELDADLKARTVFKTKEEQARHLAEYNAVVKGQVEELLTRYGKIDLLWFDGAIPAPEGDAPRLTQARVRELQPGIVLSPRYFHDGDYATFEGPVLKTNAVQRKQWAEWCTTWADGWAYTRKPFYSTGFELANLAMARSLNINMLLDVGPDANGELAPEAYTRLAEVAGWMKRNRVAVQAGALPEGEKASVPATASGKQRFLFAVPAFKKQERAMDAEMIAPADTDLILEGLATAPAKVALLGDGKPVASVFKAGKLTVHLPVARRTTLPDVVAVQLR